MTIPFVLNADNTERLIANGALRDLGLTQNIVSAQTAANRAAAAKATADSLNNTPLGTVPGLPVNSSGPVPTYVQPDVRNPAPRPAGVVSQANPLGL